LIHAWGQTMLLHMQSIGTDPLKIIVGTKGIDLSVFKFEHFESKPVQPIHMIVTRSLEWYYRHDLILQAFSFLKKENDGIKLHIVGDGSQRQPLEQLSNRLGIADSVVFHGRLDQNELVPLLKMSRIYISAPSTEGFSSSLMEAMACGCIPIVTDLPANRENITHGVNGFLFENGSSTDLLHCLQMVLSNQSKCNSISVTNRLYAETNFDVSINMKHFWNLYYNKLNEMRTNPA